MIASKMRRMTNGDGRQYLTGTLSYSLKSGALLLLRKGSEDGVYELVSLSGDGKPGDRSEQSLFSFVLPPEQK